MEKILKEKIDALDFFGRKILEKKTVCMGREKKFTDWLLSLCVQSLPFTTLCCGLSPLTRGTLEQATNTKVSVWLSCASACVLT